MLKHQHGCGRQNRDLFGIRYGFKSRPHGDLGLAVANVTAEQAIHRREPLHVALGVGDGRILVGGFDEFEGVLELSLPGRVRGKGETRTPLFSRRKARAAYRRDR